MFGLTIADIPSLSPQEKERYQSLYCGLCFALKERYGQISRAALSYDLAFLVMLYDSLYEPSESTGWSHCVMHPKKKAPYSVSTFSAYAADLSVALAYHKCLDDVADEGTVKAKIARRALERSYARAQDRIPEQCTVIRTSMECIASLEGDAETPPDAVSIAFGDMLGFLFEANPVSFPDIWSNGLRRLGEQLGRFIYLMDAAIDFKQDKRTGSYNPFNRVMQDADPEAMRAMLSDSIAQAADAFERLPLVQDAHLMRSVLYSGVWQKFNRAYHQDARVQGA